MTTVWKQAEQPPVVGEDTGDILNVLKCVKQKYLGRAEKHVKAGRIQQSIFYTDSANAVQALIEQGE